MRNTQGIVYIIYSIYIWVGVYRTCNDYGSPIDNHQQFTIFFDKIIMRLLFCISLLLKDKNISIFQICSTQFIPHLH